MKQLNRRELLGAATAAACWCTFCDTAKMLAAEDMAARDLADAPASQPTTLDLGDISNFNKDGIFDKFIDPGKVILIRNGGKLYAITSICTHQGGPVGKDSVTSLKCARHGAMFDLNGNVTKGPARLPLVRYGISLDSNKHVIVDKSKKFQANQSADEGSFLKVG